MTKQEYKEHIKEVFKCQYERLVVVTDMEKLERSTNQKPKPKNKEERLRLPKQERKRENKSRVIRDYKWTDV